MENLQNERTNGKQPTGRCFIEAYDHLMALENAGDAAGCWLAHGFVTRNAQDGETVHAWVERDSTGIVVDISNGNNIYMAKDKYYEVYGVSGVVRYNWEEAVFRNGGDHYGPWDASFSRPPTI